jgi:hypothetical protein
MDQEIPRDHAKAVRSGKDPGGAETALEAAFIACNAFGSNTDSYPFIRWNIGQDLISNLLGCARWE